jgi:hypothetical protein
VLRIRIWNRIRIRIRKDPKLLAGFGSNPDPDPIRILIRSGSEITVLDLDSDPDSNPDSNPD